VTFPFEPPGRPTIPVEGSSQIFPVRRIWCVGRNYADHAREMGHDPDREPPFFFGKPADAIAPLGGMLSFPSATQDLHHEVELAVVLRAGGQDLDLQAAEAAVFGCALALDMTRRDLQAQAKRLSRPWDMAKGFDESCPISAIRPSPGSAPRAGAISLRVNDQLRQGGDLSELIWSVPEIIAALSQLVALGPGDVILTGTPAGVGSVARGDVLEAQCALAPSLKVQYA
jgi:fumarylpyruvate hydrolase